MNDQLIKLDGVLSEIQNAPIILKANQDSVSNAKKHTESFLSIYPSGLNQQGDSEAKTIQSRLRETKKQMNERRQPFTKVIDIIKKEFTSQESEVSDLIDKVQIQRDAFARREAERKAEEERIAREKQERLTQIAELESGIFQRLNEIYIRDEQIIKSDIFMKFNALNLETVDSVVFKQPIHAINFEIFLHLIQTSEIASKAERLQGEEVREIVIRVFDRENKASFESMKRNIDLYLSEITDKLPSKRAELLEAKRIADEQARLSEQARIEAEERAKAIAAAKEVEERERLQRQAEEAAKRQEQERIRLQQEAQAQRQAEIARQEEEEKRRQEEAKRQEEEAAQRANLEKQNAIFEAQMESGFSVAQTTAKANIVESYEITAINPAAYLLMIQLFFDREGKNWPIDKLENMTFGRAKKYCEDIAKKEDVFIKSTLLCYDKQYKSK